MRMHPHLWVNAVVGLVLSVAFAPHNIDYFWGWHGVLFVPIFAGTAFVFHGFILGPDRALLSKTDREEPSDAADQGERSEA